MMNEQHIAPALDRYTQHFTATGIMDIWFHGVWIDFWIDA